MLKNKLINIALIKENLNFYDLANYFEEKKVKSSYNAVSMCCPFHEDDTPSFVYNMEKKTFWCFGCKVSGDAVDYVMAKKQCGFLKAVEFLFGFAGLSPEYVDRDEKVRVPQYKKELTALKRLEKKKKDSFEYFTENDIKTMVGLRGDFFKDRNLSQETLDYFEVGFDLKEKRVTLPIRDENGFLAGATGRTIYTNYKERGIPKWRHYKGSNINENFFNIHNAIKFSKDRNHSIIVCEGPNDVMRLHESGFQNTVACLSNTIGNVQKGLLLKNFLNVYLFLDGDLGGETGKSSIYDSLKGYFTMYEVKAIDGKDPDEMTEEQIKQAISLAKKI